MCDTRRKTSNHPNSSSSFPFASSPCPSLYCLLAAAVVGWRRRGAAPAACSSNSGRGGGRADEGMYPFEGEPAGGNGRSAAADPAAAPAGPAGVLAAKPLEQMTPREVMRLLPTEDQEHVMRVAKQGRLFGLFSATATGAWVYKALRRRGSPFPIVGGAVIGLALGYPLGITLTMAFHGRFLRRISHDLMETQRRARERASGDDRSVGALLEQHLLRVLRTYAAEYYSTFPAGLPGGEQRSARHWSDVAAAEAAEQQQQQGWGDSTEFLHDRRAVDAAEAAQPQQPRGGPTAGGDSKARRVDGTGKDDEILKV